MLDFDLAKIYGYSTSSFNQQVSRNIEKFDSDFMFDLTKDEFQNLISQNVISSRGGRRKLPHAFTLQGIYMLMTVLKGEFAVRQSKALIRLFKSMKDYLIENPPLLAQNSYLALAGMIESHSRDIADIREKKVTHSDLSDFIKLFDQGIHREEILILDGQPFKADAAYQKIYRKAKKTIIVVDDYIGVKTLQHLAHAKGSVTITIISDNAAKPRLTLAEYQDYLIENPGRNISLLQSLRQCHDRYIIVDEGAKDMKVYHCGASSKDAGKRITTITRILDLDEYKSTIRKLLTNPPLLLR